VLECQSAGVQDEALTFVENQAKSKEQKVKRDKNEGF